MSAALARAYATPLAFSTGRSCKTWQSAGGPNP
jgi:hypothetical protein